MVAGISMCLKANQRNLRMTSSMIGELDTCSRLIWGRKCGGGGGGGGGGESKHVY